MRRLAFAAALLATGALAACQSAGSAPTMRDGEPAAGLVASSWRLVQPADGSQPQGHAEASFARVGDQLVLIGGRGNPPTHIFDLGTCAWREGSKAPFQIHHFQAVTVGGDIYALGAFTDGFPDEKPISHVMIYNVASDSWRRGPEIPEDRRRGAAAAVRIGDWVYVLNGIRNGHLSGHVNWADRVHIETGEWQILADSPRARDHLAAAVADGKIVVGGGRRSMRPDIFKRVVPEVDVYDPATNSWATPSSSRVGRAGIAASPMDGMAVFLGGESGAQAAAHDEVDGFSAQTGLVSLPAMPVPRHGFGAAAAREDGRDAIYVAGGVPTRGGGEKLTALHRLGSGPGPCDK